MSYEATGRISARRSGGRYEEYAGPYRDRPRDHLIDEKPRSRRDNRSYRHEVYELSPRREFRSRVRRDSYSRHEVYDAIREPIIPYKRFVRTRQSTETPRPSKVLGVFGLSTRTTERDLYNIFSNFGRVREIKMVYDNLSGRSRGFAFVYFDSTEDARRAKSNCDDGLEIDGRMTRVDFSITQAPHQPTPGVYMGKFKRSQDFDEEDRRVRRFSRDYGGRGLSPRKIRREHIQNRRSLGTEGIRRPERNSRHRVRTMSSSRSRSPPPVYTQQQQQAKNQDITSSRRSRSKSVGSPLPNGREAKKARILDQTSPEEGSISPV